MTIGKLIAVAGETEGIMVQFKLKQLKADKEFREGRKVNWVDVSAETGISRVTLSKIANSKGDVSIRTETIEKLCQYFECALTDLMVIVPDKDGGQDGDGENG